MPLPMADANGLSGRLTPWLLKGKKEHKKGNLKLGEKIYWKNFMT